MREIYRRYIKDARKEGKSADYIIHRLKGKVSEDNVMRYLRRLKI
jgi:hypothetical protein